jgi:hypothetical protein
VLATHAGTFEQSQSVLRMESAAIGAPASASAAGNSPACSRDRVVTRVRCRGVRPAGITHRCVDRDIRDI